MASKKLPSALSRYVLEVCSYQTNFDDFFGNRPNVHWTPCWIHTPHSSAAIIRALKQHPVVFYWTSHSVRQKMMHHQSLRPVLQAKDSNQGFLIWQVVVISSLLSLLDCHILHYRCFFNIWDLHSTAHVASLCDIDATFEKINHTHWKWTQWILIFVYT